jgi:hypothetical protein
MWRRLDWFIEKQRFLTQSGPCTLKAVWNIFIINTIWYVAVCELGRWEGKSSVLAGYEHF